MCPVIIKEYRLMGAERENVMMTFKKILPFMAAAVFMAAIVMALPTPQNAAASEGSIPYLKSLNEVERAVMGSQTLVLVQFDAKWCGYCRALQPHLETLRQKNPSTALEMYKVDIDQARDVAIEFQVSTLPTMFMVHKGRVVGYKRGALDEGQLFDWVDDVRKQIRKS